MATSSALRYSGAYVAATLLFVLQWHFWVWLQSEALEARKAADIMGTQCLQRSRSFINLIRRPWFSLSSSSQEQTVASYVLRQHKWDQKKEKKRKVQIVKVALEPQSFPLMLLSVHAFNNHYLVALPSLLIISETWFVMMLTNVIKAPSLSSKRCFRSALLKRKTWMCWLAFSISRRSFHMDLYFFLDCDHMWRSAGFQNLQTLPRDTSAGDVSP